MPDDVVVPVNDVPAAAVADPAPTPAPTPAPVPDVTLNTVPPLRTIDTVRGEITAAQDKKAALTAAQVATASAIQAVNNEIKGLLQEGMNLIDDITNDFKTVENDVEGDIVKVANWLKEHL